MAKVLPLPSVRWADILEKWFGAMKPNTQKSYRMHWAHFRAICRREPSTVTELDAHEYTQAIDRKLYSAATINARVSCIRCIFDHLVAYRVCRENPFRFGPAAKFRVTGPQRRPHVALDSETVRRILEVPSRVTRDGLRDRAMLAVLFGGGLRLDEMLSIRIEDLRFSPKMLRVRLPMTKTGAEQRAVLSEWVAERIRAWLKVRPECPDPHLFLSNRLTKMSPNNFGHLFRKHCAELGIRCTVHSARVTAITHLLNAGVSHREVQEFSRHASIQMVERYHRWFVEDEGHPGLKVDYAGRKRPKRK